MRAPASILALALITACSSLPSSGDGIVALEIRYTPPLTLKQGASLTLPARALNQQGEAVAAEIRWSTPDTLALTVDSVSGLITARVGTGSGRVQARVGTLRSDLLVIALQP